jgi:hypothetical protein
VTMTAGDDRVADRNRAQNDGEQKCAQGHSRPPRHPPDDIDEEVLERAPSVRKLATPKVAGVFSSTFDIERAHYIDRRIDGARCRRRLLEERPFTVQFPRERLAGAAIGPGALVPAGSQRPMVTMAGPGRLGP